MELTLGINVIENISEMAHFDLVQRFFFYLGQNYNDKYNASIFIYYIAETNLTFNIIVGNISNRNLKMYRI